MLALVSVLGIAGCSATPSQGSTSADKPETSASASGEATPTPQDPVTVSVDTTGVTVDQAATCSGYGIDEAVQRALGDTTLTYLDSSPINSASSGSSCTWQNAAGTTIGIGTGVFGSASSAASRLTGLRTTMKAPEDISVAGSDAAFATSDSQLPVALAQFGATIVQVSSYNLSTDVDGSVPTSILSALKH